MQFQTEPLFRLAMHVVFYQMISTVANNNNLKSETKLGQRLGDMDEPTRKRIPLRLPQWKHVIARSVSKATKQPLQCMAEDALDASLGTGDESTQDRIESVKRAAKQFVGKVNTATAQAVELTTKKRKRSMKPG